MGWWGLIQDMVLRTPPNIILSHRPNPHRCRGQSAGEGAKGKRGRAAGCSRVHVAPHNGVPQHVQHVLVRSGYVGHGGSQCTVFIDGDGGWRGQYRGVVRVADVDAHLHDAPRWPQLTSSISKQSRQGPTREFEAGTVRVARACTVE